MCMCHSSDRVFWDTARIAFMRKLSSACGTFQTWPQMVANPSHDVHQTF